MRGTDTELGGDRPLVICGLNPSVANETDNDPTITRAIVDVDTRSIPDNDATPWLR